MTDAPVIETPRASGTEEDKVLPAVVYGLYLLGCATGGLSAVVGLIVAYVNRDTAGATNESHYTFAIRTFWLSIGWFLLGALVALFGAPLSLLLIGIPILVAGFTIMGAVGVWFMLRCGMGLYYLVRGEAYPRPLSWLI